MDKPKPGIGFGIMVLRNNKLLLGKRNDDPAKASSALHGAGTWTMPGGKLHFQETFEEGAYRELLEETGMSLDKTKLKLISITNNIVSDAHFVTIGLLCEHSEGEPKVLEPDEIVEWRWFDLNNLPKPLYPASEQVLKNFLNKTVY